MGKQTRNSKFGLMADSRFTTGDILAIKRGSDPRGNRVIVLEVQRPDWAFLQGAYHFRRLSKVPPGTSPWMDDVREFDPVEVIGRTDEPDIAEKLKRYGVTDDAKP